MICCQSLVATVSFGTALQILQHEKPDGAGEVGDFGQISARFGETLLVQALDQAGERQAVALRDGPQLLPERFFDRDAGGVAGDGDRALLHPSFR